ncbi:serine/threonine protein kinase [uncultured Shewanella sp.]|uniref:serine/threonine protein kinase n=1 Tax=uncultured Shewanella sp. TaxID=173975 RepID=UPI003704124D
MISLYDIFVQTLSLPIVQQSAFIHQQCKGDQALIDEINLLIANDNDLAVDDWSKLMADQFNSVSNHITSLTGCFVGAFKLVELIGQGGMGAVYLADRIDEKFEQKVAVKIINQQLEHFIGKEALIREASFMAKLNHPNIGKVFDAGVSDDGYSYIVMELVEGSPISTLWTDNGVRIEDKLTVFCRLCDAIHYAHQNQIVHADLKPANIFVDKTNQIKVLDFGIARIFCNSDDQSQQIYKTYVKALTSTYASPEVKLGELANTTSDIYSLGLILKDLLHSSYKYSKSRELLAIADKASCLDSSLRYLSALDLKYDIERYLNHQNVGAYSGSYWFKLNKFVFKRYPIPTLTALSFVAAVTYLTGNLYVQFENIKVAKNQSDLVVKKLSELLEMADLKKSNGKELLALDLLDNAKKLVKEDKVLNADSIAKIKLTLADSYESIGNIAEAKILYQEVISKVALLSDSDLAFKAGGQLVQLYNYSNEFSLIDPNTSVLLDHLTFSNVDGLPDTPLQAIFYHYYLNGQKYHLYQSMPSRMGLEHINLIRNIKAHYWDDLTDELKGNVLGALGGAIENQIPIGIEFNFEQTDEQIFDSQYKPLIEEAVIALNQSIEIYTSLNNQIEVLKKQLVLGRAYIELDRFKDGQRVMNQALNSHKKIVGEQHPNNIHFYRMIAGFYAYDAPQLSYQAAVDGVTLAKTYLATNPGLYLNSLEVMLFTLYNTGDFDQYQQYAQLLFNVYLSLDDDKRDVASVTLAAKVVDEYLSIIGKAPEAMPEIVTHILNDVERLVSGHDNIPQRTTALFSPAFTAYLLDLTISQNLVLSRIHYLQSQGDMDTTEKRDVYFYNKKQLELAYLLSESANTVGKPDIALAALPQFTWGLKERRYSANRLDVLIKEAKIALNYHNISLSKRNITQIKTLLDNRNLDSNNDWYKQYQQLVDDVAAAEQSVRVAKHKVNIESKGPFL